MNRCISGHANQQNIGQGRQDVISVADEEVDAKSANRRVTPQPSEVPIKIVRHVLGVEGRSPAVFMSWSPGINGIEGFPS